MTVRVAVPLQMAYSLHLDWTRGIVDVVVDDDVAGGADDDDDADVVVADDDAVAVDEEEEEAELWACCRHGRPCSGP